MTYTIDQVVAADVQNTDAITAMSERHAAEMAPLTKKKEAFRQWLLGTLNASNMENVRTQFGTAYKSTIMSATIDPEGGWDNLMNYIVGQALDAAATVMEHAGTPEQAVEAFRQHPTLALLNRGVNKTAVAELMEKEIGRAHV